MKRERERERKKKVKCQEETTDSEACGVVNSR